jgi:hypothetical protein
VPAGAQWEGIDLTSLTRLRNASVALIIGAFALSACGGPTASTAPTSPAATSAAPTTAATTPPATTPPVITLPPGTAAPTGGAKVDPADDLEIDAPYSLDPLDEAIAGFFVTAMEQSLGSLADVFDVGVRSATKGGEAVAFVIVMGFPDLPVGMNALLDGAAEGAAGSGGTVETRNIGGQDVRIVEVQGQTFVLMVIDDELVMVIAQSFTKKDSVDVATALIGAN